jgi:hypothetical protein
VKHARTASVIAASLFLITLIQTIPDSVQGGRPVFAASVQVTFDDFEQYPSQMEVGPDGTIYILYQSNQRSFKWCAYMVSSSDGGSNWTSPVRVDDRIFPENSTVPISNYRINPRMAIGPDGTIYIVWEDYRNFKGDIPESRPVEIRMTKSTDNGATFSESWKIDPWKMEKIWHAYQPDIAINEDGRIVIVWGDWQTSGRFRNIFSRFSLDGGVTWSENITLNWDGLYERHHYQPRIAMKGMDAYVTWHDERNLSLGPKPFLVVSHNGGVNFSKEMNVTDDFEEKSERINAEMAIDEAGNLYIVWTDQRAGFPELWMTRSEDRGASLAKNVRVVKTEERSRDFAPTIAAMRNGLISVAWYREYYDYEDSPVERDVIYTNSSNGGRTWNEVLRVDDTDRYQKDLTDQEFPQIAYTDEGRTIVCWADGRNYLPIEVSRQIFFARHSNSLTGKNILPALTLGSFEGPFEFDREIGNATTVFGFKMTYTDYDNDMPAPGYPRMRIYTADKEPFSEGWTAMTKVNESRVFYIEGIEYFANATIPVEGDYYWQVETVEERDPTVIRSPFLPGPRIDATPPIVTMLGPKEKEWRNVDTLNCSTRVTDTGGAHVDPFQIRIQYSISGPDQYQRSYMAKGFMMIDNDTYDAYASVKLGQGKENFVRFEARDMVGNGLSISQPINLWIDSTPPYFTEMTPKAADLQIYADVNCSIVWMDHIPGSSSEKTIGLNPDTIVYKYRTTTQGYSEWLEPERIVRIGPDDDIGYRAWINLKFADKGVYNNIIWRAADMLGNVKETPEREGKINVNIPENYAPVFIGDAFPNLVASETPHIWWEDAYDEEGDTLYYKVMILDQSDLLYFTSDIEVGLRTFFDIPDEKRLSPGHWKLRVNVTDRKGGWDVLVHDFRVTDFGTPPPADLPPVGPFYLRSTNETIDWAPSQSAADREVAYLVRIGTQQYFRDIMDWTNIGSDPTMNLSDLELKRGIYSFMVMAYADANYSRVSEGMLKISDYKLIMDVPGTHLAYRGSGASRAKPIEMSLINMGTYDDNATLHIEGELVQKGWAYFGDSQTDMTTTRVATSKMLTTPDRSMLIITVYPPSSAEERDYKLIIWAISEDNETVVERREVAVTIKQAPEDSKGSAISQGIYNLVTDIFPFLKDLPQWLVVLLFFIFVIGFVAIIAGIGIFIVKRSQKRKTEDPYEKHKQIYRDLYGAEPPADYKGETQPGAADDSFDVDKLFDKPSAPPAGKPGSAPAAMVAPPVVPPAAPTPVEDPLKK